MKIKGLNNTLMYYETISWCPLLQQFVLCIFDKFALHIKKFNCPYGYMYLNWESKRRWLIGNRNSLNENWSYNIVISRWSPKLCIHISYHEKNIAKPFHITSWVFLIKSQMEELIKKHCKIVTYAANKIAMIRLFSIYKTLTCVLSI